MVISNVKKQTSDLAKRAARQILQEPLEILKSTPSQISGTERRLPNVSTRAQENVQITQQEKAKLQVQGQRQLEALETELKEIQRQKEYNERVVEQQEEMQKAQSAAIEKPLSEPAPKHSRRLFSFGKKAQAEKQKTRVERPLPPSG